jgi:hypothetical protein
MLKPARRLAFCAAMIAAGAAWAQPTTQPTAAPALKLTLQGEAQIVFTPKRDACDGNDVPDAPLRAFHAADGSVVAFGLHFVNRALRGPTLDAIKVDCKVVLNSKHLADPAAYDDYNWITAVWTNDGRTIDALVHHEYHANEHPGRCGAKDMMSCWFNTVLGYRSTDGGQSFARAGRDPVVASAPFTQDLFQGRHRGFFNPSNIVGDGDYRYFMSSTTGWSGQNFGVCLFRTRDPADPTSWRAWDGSGFSRRFGDPYAARKAALNDERPCQPIPPFQAPVGSILRHRASGQWIATYQAWKDEKYHPVAGIYYATSRDLKAWSTPRLLIAGATNYDDPCKAPGMLLGYPSLVDPHSQARNFDDAGDSAQLYYVTLETNGCSITSKRDLLRRAVTISPETP